MHRTFVIIVFFSLLTRASLYFWNLKQEKQAEQKRLEEEERAERQRFRDQVGIESLGYLRLRTTYVARSPQSPPVLPVPPNPWDSLRPIPRYRTGSCCRYSTFNTLSFTYWFPFSGGRRAQEECRRPAAPPRGGLGSSGTRGGKEDRDGGRGGCEGGGGRRRTRGGRGGGARRVQAEGTEAQGVRRTHFARSGRFGDEGAMSAVVAAACFKVIVCIGYCVGIGATGADAILVVVVAAGRVVRAVKHAV